MSATFGGRTGRQGKLSSWLRGRRPQEAPDGSGREALLLAAAEAGLPLAPAAHPAPGYRCSCDRVGCPTPARHPVSFAWQTQSTTDRAQIERWARHQPQANFITATGMVNDVLDVPPGGRTRGAGAAAGRRRRGRPGRRERRRTAALLHPHPRHPEDEDEWWPCELDCHPETMDEHPGLRWHCRGSYVLVPRPNSPVRTSPFTGYAAPSTPCRTR